MPRTSNYTDSGKISPSASSGGDTGVPTQNDAADSATQEVFGAVVDGCAISRHVVEQYRKSFLTPDLQPDPHNAGFSGTRNGNNTPYADQHAPAADTHTPGPKD